MKHLIGRKCIYKIDIWAGIDFVPTGKNELTGPASNSFASENKDSALHEHNNNSKLQHSQPNGKYMEKK